MKSAVYTSGTTLLWLVLLVLVLAVVDADVVNAVDCGIVVNDAHPVVLVVVAVCCGMLLSMRSS